MTIFYLTSIGFIPKLEKSSFGIFGYHYVNPLSLITSTFFHNSWAHVTVNSFSFIYIGLPFFYFLGIRRGLILYVLIALLSGILEYLFIVLNNIFMLLYVDYYKDCQYFSSDTNSTVRCLQGGNTIYGVGASGVIIGFCSFLIILFFWYSWILFKNKDYYYAFWCLFSGIFFSYVSLERIVADLSLYFNWTVFMLKEYHQALIPSVFSYLNTLFLPFINNKGNPSLIHTWGVISGLGIGLFFVKKRVFKYEN